ncbi:MAG: hypothetical protein FWG48_02945 [Oscillospiraceae bacterium]|nr:hypothetical protein [Oscillospiraceae bacterium]
MSEERRQEYMSKYVRTGSDVILPKGSNPYPQMKYDSFILNVTPDFGGFGGSTLWSYIYEPVQMQPEPVICDRPRYITVFGGIATDFTRLHGAAEVSLGTSKSDMRTFILAEPFAVHMKKGMYYSINITRIDIPGVPLHYNEFILGEDAPLSEKFDESGDAGFASFIKTGEAITAKYPDKSNVPCTIMTTDSNMFKSNDMMRRTWMPITNPHIMAKQSHTHAFTEYLVCYGSDPENVSDLGGVIEFTIGESLDTLETFRIEKATQFCLRDGLLHSPLVFREVRDPRKPIIFCEVSYSDGLVQSKKYDNVLADDSLPSYDY